MIAELDVPPLLLAGSLVPAGSTDTAVVVETSITGLVDTVGTGAGGPALDGAPVQAPTAVADEVATK
jgi:hypothetical protein